MTNAPLFPDLPLRRTKADLPKRLYSQLAPSNPYTRVPFFKTLELLYKRQLATLLRSDTQLKVRANSTWLKAFEMLEERGVHLGVHINDVAKVYGVTPSTAKRAMLKAEEMIYKHYGLNVCFADNNGVWRLATEIEVARKYASAMKSFSAYAKRLKMYQTHAEETGKKTGELNIPLFELPDAALPPEKPEDGKKPPEEDNDTPQA